MEQLQPKRHINNTRGAIRRLELRIPVKRRNCKLKVKFVLEELCKILIEALRYLFYLGTVELVKHHKVSLEHAMNIIG